MLKTSSGTLASLVLLFNTPVIAQNVYYDDLSDTCLGTLYSQGEICSEYTEEGQEFRYLVVVLSEREEVRFLVSFIGSTSNLIIKTREAFALVTLDGEGELLYESFPGAYDIMNQYYTNQFVYLFNSYN